MSRRSKLTAAAVAAASALALAVAATAATYNNTAAIPIPDAQLTFPNPAPGQATSTINVSETSTITSITVTLTDIDHGNAEDLDIAVVSPSGTRVVLMSDAGRTPPENRPLGPTRPMSPIATGTDLTFSDSGATLPATGVIPSGTYKPADYGASDDPFCSGESDQPGPYTTTLSSFNGQSASGTWTLVARDDCGGYTGQIAGGWCIVVNSSSGPCAQPTAVSVASLASHRTGAGMTVTWRTASESGIAGFNVFRVSGRRAVKANRPLIRARHAGTARGASYRFVDRGVRRASYRLQVVHLDGSRSWAGVTRS